MAQTIARIQTKLMKDYYGGFSKYSRGRSPEKKIAWVTAFTPVEILEALNISYYYPESYAAVIAASEREQQFIDESNRRSLSRDCCSYSCCFNGSLDVDDGPRGVPPKPDVLIATNNQCSTLANWWNVLSVKYDIPLIILDYPGESTNDKDSFEYVTNQHKYLIKKMELLSGNTLSGDILDKIIDNSERSVSAWNSVVAHLPKKNIDLSMLFDDINYLIISRCKPETAVMYKMMSDTMDEKQEASKDDIPVFWIGYPLWYHESRYLKEYLDGFKIVGSNYLTWWSLDYSGNDAFERLFNAYNYTFLNLMQKSRNRKLLKLIEESGAKGAIVLHNKSCKCDFVSAKNITIPQAELEIDMIDRHYLDINKARVMIELLKDILCIE